MKSLKLGRIHILISAGVLLCAPYLYAQSQGVDILLSKARSLEARGRMDLAAADWKEVLLVNPNQTEALAGLARVAKENGNNQEEQSYLDRLKRINPKNPQIAAIQNMHILTRQELDKLDEAGRLAMQHKPDDAMKLYNEVFGNQPPAGKWAQPYYETEAASTSGRQKAISQLRKLSAADPQNETYRLWLARVLVYDPASRMEGLRLLASIQDPATVEQARTQWREALLWEKDNPAVLASVNAYLQRYSDPELSEIQKRLQSKQEHAQEDAAKASGFQALRSKDISKAEADFENVLRRDPKDINALAGLAFVRLNQKRFDEAVTLFDRARTIDPKRADVRDGYATAKFWSLMQQGSRAMSANQPEAAIAVYESALAIHPGDQQATLGLAQADLRAKRMPDAENEFQQVLNESPNNADAISGMGFIRLDEKKFAEAAALFDKARRLSPNRPELEQSYNDAEYWSLLQQGATALDQNNASTAISDYRQALVIRPGAPDALQGLAGAAERSKNYAEAKQAYDQLARVNSSDANTWLALIRIELANHNPQQAIATAAQVPPTVKPQVENRADYLAELALAYYSSNEASQADPLLHRAMQAASIADSTEALNTRLEIAALLMKHGRDQEALPVYQQATRLHPDNLIAWEGMIGAYTGRQQFSQAESTVRSMPENVRNTAAKDPGFLNAMAAIYSANGECGRAEDALHRSLMLDRSAGRQTAEGTELQLADIWLREGNYSKARHGYQQVLAHDSNSISAWRGYLNALHDLHDDQAVISESKRIPASIRAQLDADPDFLVLLAGSHSALSQGRESVQLLQQARGIYQTQGKVVPADLDVQLAWAMLNEGSADLQPLVRKLLSRSDLNNSQRATVEQIWSYGSVRAANQAMQQKQWSRAIDILEDAQSDLKNDPKIYSTLALLYVKEHRFAEALNVYGSWNMTGAEPGDYEAAAGAAQGAHKRELADFYMRAGLRQFPNDAGLLEMQGKQEIADGNYREGQNYLKQALSAERNPAVRQNLLESSPQGPSAPNVPPVPDYRALAPAASATTTPPACHQSFVRWPERPSRAHIVNASFLERQAGDRGQNDQGGSQSGTPNAEGTQPNSNQAPANQPPANQNGSEQSNSSQSSTTAGVNSAQSNPDERQRLEDEIDVVQNRNTPFADINEAASGRAGTPGIDRLLVEDGRVGGSVTAFDKVRVSTYADGLYLYSGTPTGRSQTRFGTLAPGAVFGRQETGGMTGELQISTATFGLDASATPNSFPVQNFIGGIRFRPFGGPFTLLATRDSVKDSLLSYAGVRDPGTGVVWGGVVANTATLRFDHSSRRAGQYASAGYSYMTGRNVTNNQEVFGNAGLYFVVVKNLSVGVNAYGMHYEKNLSFFSLGQGGYFSPQQYGLASIPISWFSRHKRFEYEIRASLGAQYISQDASLFFPTNINAPLPHQGTYASNVSTGANYSFLGRLGVHLASHVYLDAFASANNTRNYAYQTVGFSIKILAHRLPANTDLHVNSIPDWKGNQPFGLY